MEVIKGHVLEGFITNMKEDDDVYQEMGDELYEKYFGIKPGKIMEINGKTYQFSGEKQEWIPLAT